jgi:DNA repair protein RecO (recombination protein O)
MELEKKEGVVVKSLNYQEHQRIITLFTEEGLISLICKIYPKNPHSLLLTTPLCRGEFLYKKTSSELQLLKEGTVLSSHHRYNLSYAHLKTAFSFLHTLTSSQLPHKPAPLLYKLLTLYLDKLSSISSPQTLSSSFMLKTLRHEGFLSLEGICSCCEQQQAQAFFQKEFYCKQCKPLHSICFEDHEWNQFQTLLFSKDFSMLDSLVCEDSLHEKITSLFKETLT